MSLARYYMALLTSANANVFPYPQDGLVQCCDLTLDRPATGVVTQWKDVSGNANHLLAGPNGGPTLGTAPDGRAAIFGLADNQFLASVYGKGYTSYTLVLLQYVEPTGFSVPWFGRPQPEYQPSPFIYTDGNQLKSYFSIAYGNYGSVFGQWQLVLFSYDAASGYAFQYQTGRGFSPTENPDGAVITGATLAAHAAEKYRAFAFYDAPLSTVTASNLIQTLSARHKLAL